MSSLTLIVALVATAPMCEGDEAEVPVRFSGWAADDAQWIESELSTWFSARDRRLCAARDLEAKWLTVAQSGLEVAVSFEIPGRRVTRVLPDASASESSELFRYRVAATAEELARATWEALPSPRFALFAHGDLSLLASGPVFIGGGIGARLTIAASWFAELRATVSHAPASALEPAATLSGTLVSGTLSIAWLPLCLGVVCAGPRASVEVGALRLNIVPNDGTTVSGTLPLVSLLAGASVGIESHHLTLNVYGQGGSIVVGGVVFADGAPVRAIRGPHGSFGVQAGARW